MRLNITHHRRLLHLHLHNTRRILKGKYITIQSATTRTATTTTTLSTTTSRSLVTRWDEKSYFRSIFDGIDLNRNGEIDQRELHEALRLGQPTLTFDPATVRLLIHKYDSNRDERVNFNEFYGLFVDINNQYNEFLDIDADCSGSIDARELAAALQRKRYPLSAAFYDRLVAMIAERTRSRALSFDLYVRVIARLDFLLRVCRERGNDRNMEAFILHEFLVHF